MSNSIGFDDLDDVELDDLEVDGDYVIFAVDEDGTWLETTALSTDTPVSPPR